MPRRLLVVAVLLFLVRPVAAQGPGKGRWVDSIFASYNRKNAPGCAVGVVEKGTLTYSRGFGDADLRLHVPNSPSTAFYLASLSKQFTAMSIVLLEQDGKLNLDDDVRKWVPEVPRLGVITLRELLQHTSGLRDYYTLLGINGWRANELLTESDFLNLIARQQALNFAPGTDFLYSNTGYALLSIVVRRASGRTLRDFAAERIFAPLGMRNTEFRDDHTRAITDEAIGYVPQNGGNAVSIPQLDVVGDGGAFSTIEDMAKWDANLYTGKVGGPAGVALLQTEGSLPSGRGIGYGLGLGVGTFDGNRLVSHNGAYGGYRASYLRFPDERLSVITLCNVTAPSAQLAQQVASVYLVPAAFRLGDGASFDDAPEWGIAKPITGPDALKQIQEPDEQVWLEGKYFSAELDMEFTLRSENSVLVMRRPVGADLTFTRISRDLYTTPDKVTLQVDRDASGTVSGFRLSTNRARNIRFVKRSGLVGSFGASDR